MIDGVMVTVGIAVLGAASSWGALWQRLRAHEQADIDRFQVHALLLKEIRDDIKELLWHRNDDDK